MLSLSVTDSLLVSSTWNNLHEIEVFDGTKCGRKRLFGESHFGIYIVNHMQCYLLILTLTLDWLIIVMFCRPCLRMSVGLVLGTGDGPLFKETNFVSGSIPMKKQERSVVYL